MNHGQDGNVADGFNNNPSMLPYRWNSIVK